jgi:hypothetical protein
MFVLVVFEVDLALFFGLLTFVLGYIPNIGPAISVFLPLPMVVLDPRPMVVRLIFIFIFLAANQVRTLHEVGVVVVVVTPIACLHVHAHWLITLQPTLLSSS